MAVRESPVLTILQNAPAETAKSAREPFFNSFDVEQYLAEERAKDLLRFSTAGSVDDGKSTLIGRLLYDTQSIYDDQLRSIEGKGTTAPGVLDLALLTDGLRAEREQGITIDVAYRYFATARRKFIIADTPGHEQYTRNMATGASTADVAVVLVDARKGVLRQSRRHASITALLGVPQIVVAVNKMDLVEWNEAVFAQIREQFTEFFQTLDFGPATGQGTPEATPAAALHFVPVSALTGDNVVQRSEAMPWYAGPTLLQMLEALPSSAYRDAAAGFRLPVQRIARPNLDFRGFAGQIAAGTIRPGDPVQVLPSGKRSRVARIVTYDGDLPSASAPLSVTLTLEDEIDISRGDLLVAAPVEPSAEVAAQVPAQVATAFEASLVWMSETPLAPERRYLVKQTSRTVQGFVRAVERKLDFSGERVADPRPTQPATLGLNDIGLVRLETLLPLSVDLYAANRYTGSFILIDSETNATVAAGMIRAVLSTSPRISAEPAQDSPRNTETFTISPAERAAAWGHCGATLAITAAPALAATLADALERALFARGAFVLQTQNAAAAWYIAEAGALAIIRKQHSAGDSANSPQLAPRFTVESRGQTQTLTLAQDPEQTVAQALTLLQNMGTWTKTATGELRR